MGRYFSIRWKILLLAGLVMSGLATLFSLQQNYTLNRHFEVEQETLGQRMAVTTNRLLLSQNERLQVLARMLVETPAIRVALANNDPERLAQAVEPLWPELSMGQGLLALAFIDTDQNLLRAWGDPSLARLTALARVAQTRETPQSWLGCASHCAQIVVLPATERGQPLGTIAVVTGLESMVLDLRRLGNAEVGLILTPQGATAGSAPAQVLSVSGGPQLEAILGQALSRLVARSYTSVNQSGRTWHVTAFSPDFPGDGLLRVAMLADVTTQRQAIRDSTLSNLGWSVVALALALFFLYLALRPAMQRIQRVSRLLPLLGQERYAEMVQEALPSLPRVWIDEMHALERLAFELAHRLQALHDADEAHAATLAAQAAQLEQERDLVAGLLDTAPVLIVTYGLDSRIRMANAYAVMDSGLTRDQLLGQLYGYLFLDSSERESHRRLMAEMRPGDVQRGEGCFTQGNGSRRDVVWFHSCLDDARGERLFLSVGLDVTEHRLAEQRLQLLVERDGVTGLLNRRAFKSALESLLEKQTQGILLVCDLDEFRSLNDADGHEAGDRVLALFAEHIQRLDPRPALTARLGSDEFALVFPEINTADAILIARNLNRVVTHAALGPEVKSVPRHISASVGLVELQNHGTHARAKGHGSWHLYSDEESYRERADRRAYWRDEVELALDDHRFVLHYQPIIDVETGQVSHYEALLRMVGRDGKLVPPGYFIDVAESTGLIRRIDRWVLEAAVKTAAEHREAKLAFNLSSRSFDDDVAVEAMYAALKRHRVAGERLLIEITETAALANFSGAKRIMAKFQDLGCVFGLDDFGVGYSSFQYLKELPVGFVKIDGSFIKNLTKNPDDVVFVRALNSAVQGFGKTTVAEFVEDEATLEILREIGVDHAQGYLIGKPAPTLGVRLV